MSTHLSVRCGLLSLIALLASAGNTLGQEAATKTLPSAKEVIARNLEATGSKAAIDSLKSLIAEGTVGIPQAGLTGELKVYQRSDGKASVKIDLPGVGKQEIGTDGKVFWEASEITGAEILDGERAAQARLQLSLNALGHYENFFDTMECTGIEDFEGQPCYVLRSQKGDFEPITDYFSVETGLQAGSKIKAATAVGQLEIVSVISEHKKVGDFTMPHKTVAKLPNGMTQEVTIKSMEFNKEIPPEAFEVPEEVKELLKQ